MGSAESTGSPRGGPAVRDEGVFAASVWRSESGDLVGRVQIATGHDEPTVTVTGTIEEIREMFERWIATLQRHRAQDGPRTSS